MTAQNNQITAPRVDLIDENTGKIRREWYMFLYSLYTITGSGTGITPVINGGTGLGTIPTNGQLLIGNGTGYALNTLGYGVGISVTNGAGTIVVANTGVLSNIAGTGISVSGATGNVTISNTGVLSWSGGSTGLTPATDTTGAITLGGKLAIGYGGTNGTATPIAGAVSYGTGTAYGFTAAGTSGQVLTSAGASTPTWTTPTTGTVTSVGLSMPTQFTVTNSPVTTSGTLTAAWNTQTANYVLAGPTTGAAATPTFRALVATDVPALSYVTSVGGTGTVNGITLTGTVTSSGSLTLGGTLGGIGNSQLTNSTISGVALGGNLFNLTAGTGVSFSSGTTYNGSAAITITATGSGGTVTSVTGTSPVVSSGGTTPAISLAAAYGDTLNPYASKTANYVLAAPNGSAGVPTFRALVATDVPGSALTKTDDTNVTLTLGGSPTTALLNAASLTLGWTGQLGISRGGTNTSTAPSVYGVVYGNSGGTAYTSLANGTTGQVLTATTGAAPTWAAPATSGTVTSVSVTSGNGFAGTVATATTTPAITISTSITGLLYGNGTALAATTISTPLSYSAGTLSIPVATASANGYLSSTDWSTFNNKSPAVTFTTNYVPFGQGTTTLNQSANLQFTGTNLGIGVATPSSLLDLYNASNSTINVVSDATTNVLIYQYSNNSGGPGLQFRKSRGTSTSPLAVNTGDIVNQTGYYGYDGASFRSVVDYSGYIETYTAADNISGYWRIRTRPAGAGAVLTERMRVFSSGGVSIGNTSDPGSTNLSVTGTISSGVHTANSFIPTSATIPTNGMYLNSANSVAFATNSAYVFNLSSDQRVQIGSLSTQGKLGISGDSVNFSPSADNSSNGIGCCVVGSNIATTTQGSARLYMTGANTAHAGCLDLRAGSVINSTLNVYNTSGTQTILIHSGTGSYFNAAGGLSVGSTTDPGTGNFSASGTVKTGSYTVATLPTAGTIGRRAQVTNALAPAFGSTVVGGGAIVIPVFDNGTNWIVG